MLVVSSERSVLAGDSIKGLVVAALRGLNDMHFDGSVP
jgi:hypothetical protein